jgi:hypothetical protein
MVGQVVGVGRERPRRARRCPGHARVEQRLRQRHRAERGRPLVDAQPLQAGAGTAPGQRRLRAQRGEQARRTRRLGIIGARLEGRPACAHAPAVAAGEGAIEGDAVARGERARRRNLREVQCRRQRRRQRHRSQRGGLALAVQRAGQAQRRQRLPVDREFGGLEPHRGRRFGAVRVAPGHAVHQLDLHRRQGLPGQRGARCQRAREFGRGIAARAQRQAPRRRNRPVLLNAGADRAGGQRGRRQFLPRLRAEPQRMAGPAAVQPLRLGLQRRRRQHGHRAAVGHRPLAVRVAQRQRPHRDAGEPLRALVVALPAHLAGAQVARAPALAERCRPLQPQARRQPRRASRAGGGIVVVIAGRGRGGEMQDQAEGRGGGDVVQAKGRTGAHRSGRGSGPVTIGPPRASAA